MTSPMVSSGIPHDGTVNPDKLAAMPVDPVDPVIGLEAGNCAPHAPDSVAPARGPVAVLAFCCLCWGFSFPVVKLAMGRLVSHLPPGHADPGGHLPVLLELGLSATFNGWRFGLASLLYWLLTRSRQRGFTAAEKRGGVMIGAFFSTGLLFQLIGLRYALPSISAFLTSLVVVFAPVAQSFFFRHKVSGKIWIAVGVALIGVTILSQPNPDASSLPIPAVPQTGSDMMTHLGELLTILSALFFTGQLLALDHYGSQADSTRMTLVMFLTTACLSTLIGVVFAGSDIYSGGVFWQMAGDRALQLSILGVTVFSSVLALHLMNAYQPLVSAATASVIYCLEPLFATLFSVAFATENLSSVTALGGAMILCAVLLVAKK